MAEIELLPMATPSPMDRQQLTAFIDAMAMSDLDRLEIRHERWTLRLARQRRQRATELTAGAAALPAGVEATVVRDTASLDGVLIEDTYDWYAQDTAGNVWYFGEQVQNFERGKLSNTDGSWEAGVDGALPGIVMPAHPKTGDAYRQEYYRGQAEDMAKIIATGEHVTVPAGTYADAVVTREWSPLEPEVIERKSYAPGFGVVLEDDVAGPPGRSQLVEFTPGS